MSELSKQAWREAIERKYGSLEVYKKVRKQRKIGFQKGHTPHNKIEDEFSDLPIPKEKKYLLRKQKHEVVQDE